MSDILVSVVLIGYNVGKYLNESINSVVNQTYDNIEIIYVDDGSFDNSVEIAERFTNRKNIDFRIIRQTNIGANGARISGFLDARGDAVMFVDGDDTLPTNAIELLINSWPADSDFIAGNFSFNVNERFALNEKWTVGDFDSIQYTNLVVSDQLPPYLVGRLYRTSYLRDASFSTFPRLSMAEDLAASVLFAESLTKVTYIADTVYNYRVSEGSMSRVVSERYKEIPVALSTVAESLKKQRIINVSQYMEFRWFLIFLWYVVGNAQPGTDIQRFLYIESKKHSISLLNNSYVTAYLKNVSIARKMLLWAYYVSYGLGVCLAKIYLNVSKR